MAFPRVKNSLQRRSGLGLRSIRSRLILIFSILSILAAVFSVVVVKRRQQISDRAIESATLQYQVLDSLTSLRGLLADMDRYAGEPAIFEERVQEFRDKLEGLAGDAGSAPVLRQLTSIRDRFEVYADAMKSEQGPNARVRSLTLYENVNSAVEAAARASRERMHDLFSNLRTETAFDTRWSDPLLVGFILLLIAAAYQVITLITRPLTALARHLDQVEVDCNLPESFPKFDGGVPEVARVAESFQQLFLRLRAYQSVNVKRLLVEKRRADIIAASISDGIFLLRNDEIVYVNPVGERILDLPRGRSWRGLGVNAMAEAVGTALRERAKKLPDLENEQDSEEHVNSDAAILALHQAMTRMIPVEFELQTEQRKHYYLFQSFPISEEIIEQVEHSFDGPVEEFLDRWQANTIILGRDITLVKEGHQAKSHFIATLSHEVKTPVTSLTMATRLLKKSVNQIPNATHRALVETCAEDVDRLRGLIDNLLSVSRFDMMTQGLEFQQMDIAKLLKQSVQHFQIQAHERGVSLSLDSQGGKRSITIPADATKISWALSNLLTNAVRHSPKGGHVRAEIAETDEFVEIRVKDSGQGIDRNRQDRIFDRFNPFYDIRVARSGSVGMGLAIAREIIVAHGGRIWVVSEPGQGAEFRFTLPLRRSDSVTLDPGLMSSWTGLTQKGGVSGSTIGS